MKRIIAYLLLLAMSIGFFAGCKVNEEPTTPTTEPTVQTGPTEPADTTPAVDENLDKALEYLRVFYKNTAEKTPMDYTRIGTVRVASSVYDIEWTVDVPEDVVKVVVNADGSVTIDINEEKAKEYTEPQPYVLTAKLVGTDGREVSLSWNLLVPPAVDLDSLGIVDAAYALEKGATLEGTHTLTGKITTVNTPYSEDYKNITVTMEVPGREDKPIMCYRLKGEGADKLCVGDTITVTGVLKNYNGTIEFDAGCILEAVESGGGEVPVAPEDPKQIVDEAYALKSGKTTPYVATLTGKVTAVKEEYTEQYKNITVVMVVDGRSSKPILCYRIKGEKAASVNVNDIITVQGQLTNYQGTIEFVAGSKLLDVIDKAPPAVQTDVDKIWADAQKLSEGSTLKYEAKVSGTITQVNYPYDSYYDNITVTIKLENGNTIRCKYLKGSGVNKIGVGDDITVQGYIEKYEGNVQFIRPTLLKYTINRVSAPEDPMQIVEDAYALAEGESLLYDATLTGKVISIDDPYTTQYKNITFTMQIPGAENKPIVAYRAKGTGAETLAVGDTVTVTGVIKNYKGTVEFDTGCKISNIIKGEGGDATEPSTEPTEPASGSVVSAPEAGKAYKLGIDQTNLGQTLYFAGTMKGYYGATTEDITAAVDVVLEAVDGGYNLSFTDPEGAKKYVNVVVSGTYRNFTIADAPATVYTYDAENNTLLTDVGGTTCYMGTYGTYNTFSVSSIDKIATSFPSHFYEVTAGGEDVTEPTEPSTEPAEPSIGIVTAPETGKVYKLGIEQANLGQTLYFAGTMKGYYGATTEDTAAAVDVALEAADNGYYLTFTDPEGAKKYINVVVSGTHRNFTIADAPATVYTFDTEHNTLLTDVDGTTCYMGTYGTYNTFSVSPIDKIGSSFPSHLYEVTAGEDVTEPTTEATEPSTEATEPSTEPAAPVVGIVTAPEAGKAYKLGIDQTNLGKTIYFAGTMKGYYGATTENVDEAVDVVLEAVDGGYNLSFTDPDGAKKYVNVVVSGTYRNFTIADAPATVYTYDAENNTLLTDVNGTTCYMGTYGTYNTFSVSSIDKIGSSFPSHFYEVTAGEDVTEPTTEATEPTTEATEPTTEATEPSTEATEPSTEPAAPEFGIVTAPETGKTYKLGIDQTNLGKTLYFAGTMKGYYGATTEDKDAAVDVALEAADNGYYLTFTDDSGAKKYINVVVSGTHRNFTIADAAATVYTYDAEHNTLLTDVDGTTCYMGTYGTYNTFSVSPIDKIATSFPSHLYGETNRETEPTEPSTEATEPSTEATEPSTEPAAPEFGIVTAPETGKTYKLGIDQTNLGKILYFAGTMKGYYGATTENVEEAVDVIWESGEAGRYLTFTDPTGAKKYINVVVSGTYRNFTIADAPATVYTYDAEHNTLLTDVNGTTCYMGTYGTYNTFSVSSIDKISTSFPCHFYGESTGGTVVPEPTEATTEATEAATEATTVATEPAVDYATSVETGKVYKLGIEQGNLGKTIYFAGTMKGYYGATTEDKAAAVDVVLEAAEGGYYLSFTDPDGAKKYVNVVVSGTYRNFTIADAPATVYTFDTEHNTLLTDVNGTTCYMGTYGTYNTFSVSSIDKIGTSFPSHLYAVSGSGVNPEPTEATTEATEATTEATEATTEATEATTEATEPTAAPSGDPTPDTTLPITEAIALGASKAHNTYTEGKYYVTGEITEVYSTTYGNMYIKDAQGNVLTIYGTFDATGANRYDAMATKPVAGDTVTIYGIIGQYNDNPQMKNGWIVEHTPGEGDSGNEGEAAAAVITFDDLSKQTSFSATQKVWEENGIVVTNDKAASTSDVASNSSPVRFYKGSSVTVECTGMTKLVFNCNNPTYATTLKNSIGDTATVEGTVVTVVLSEKSDGFVIPNLTAQVRVNSIEIYK